MIKKLLFLIMCCLLYAETTAPDLLTISRSSASMARGGTFLADDQRPDLIFHNFACLGSNKKIGGSFMSGKVFNEIPYNTFSAMVKNLAVGFFGISESAGFIRDERNNRQDEIIHSDTNVYLAAGFDFKRLDLGVRLRNIKKNFSAVESSSSAFLFDLAAYYQLFDSLAIGAQFNNFSGGKLKWTSGTEENLTSVMGAGVRWQAIKKVSLFADMLIDDTGALLNLGGELAVSELLTLRAGLNQEHGAQTGSSTVAFNSFTFGLGLNVGDFLFDYAYYLSGVLNDNSTHYFTISYQFEPPAIAEQPQEVTENVLELQEKIDQDVKNISDYSDNFQDINQDIQDVSKNIGEKTKQIELLEKTNSSNMETKNVWEEVQPKAEPKEKEKLLQQNEQSENFDDFWSN